MPDESRHILTSFEADLGRLRDMIAAMGGLVETELADATAALLSRDAVMAARVVEFDARVDAEERAIEQFAIRVLALRQPVADDLRQVVAALKVTTDLERIGDYAANVAKRTIILNEAVPAYPLASLAQMSRLVQENLKSTIDAIGEADPQKAMAVWRADQMIDDLYTTIFRELITYMMEDPRNISACTHLLFIAKNLERIGDHATNVAELTYYAATGETLPDNRPKGDLSATYMPRAGA
ncbi:MAG: phosphate transport system regulatory protein PhoU [Acidiphilium sp. 37-64-53]|uniref:phosphate signaling complex protein PhoU n=1 Tax=Acidiphilium TaxID=522 RepID=UPI000BD1364D|nr:MULTISPECIES: phosphate signaling complex protein PhoU [Acidiphilium]OYW02496.1 MAG: phosphate transport system regulatory protein PhoU [Acidiphilium sp. 37-64-53]OZB21607.1 MAG: phosphate transport system regulatory protein PhoU [Acidiphilium sp. 34-64-41]HQT84919.1 phosphate signaling complex protein PhoU [Acidiphilium rubrum]